MPTTTPILEEVFFSLFFFLPSIISNPSQPTPHPYLHVPTLSCQHSHHPRSSAMTLILPFLFFSFSNDVLRNLFTGMSVLCVLVAFVLFVLYTCSALFYSSTPSYMLHRYVCIRTRSIPLNVPLRLLGGIFVCSFFFRFVRSFVCLLVC